MLVLIVGEVDGCDNLFAPFPHSVWIGIDLHHYRENHSLFRKKVRNKDSVKPLSDRYCFDSICQVKYSLGPVMTLMQRLPWLVLSLPTWLGDCSRDNFQSDIWPYLPQSHRGQLPYMGSPARVLQYLSISSLSQFLLFLDRFPLHVLGKSSL